jgi:hypothetical protein
LRFADKEDSRGQGMKQFLDDKTYRPGFGAFKREKATRAQSFSPSRSGVAGPRRRHYDHGRRKVTKGRCWGECLISCN